MAKQIVYGEPLRWIATNAGQEGAIVVAKVRDMGPEEGFNALNDTYENPRSPIRRSNEERSCELV